MTLLPPDRNFFKQFSPKSVHAFCTLRRQRIFNSEFGHSWRLLFYLFDIMKLRNELIASIKNRVSITCPQYLRVLMIGFSARN